MPAETAPLVLSAGLVARYRWHAARRALSNLALLSHRRFDGFLASMHQGGTHWLKFMLASALAERYGLPPPRYNHANDVIGGPHDPRPDVRAPWLASSHTIPHPLLTRAALRRALGLPRYVVLVRDIRAALVSNYEKWKQRYGVPFAVFLAGDPSGRRYNSDLWWCLRFLNAWGAAAARDPQATLVLRYEDLRADPHAALALLGAFLRLDLAPEHIERAVAAASKDRMRRMHDPARPPGEVRDDARVLAHWFGPDEEAFLRAACRRLLAHRYGYPYER